MKSWFVASKPVYLRKESNDLRFQLRLDSNTKSYEDSELSDFFRSLKCLKYLPINYIVPDENMLPMETIRVFFVDSDWVNYFIDGAESIGRNSRKDLSLDNTALNGIHNHFENGGTQMGFLLRSDIVSGWQGLQVNCCLKDKRLGLIRCEALNDTVFLCIAEGEFDKIVLAQPSESIHFGLLPTPDASGLGIRLKSLKSESFGRDIDETLPAIYRNEDMGVLDITKLADALKKTLDSINMCGSNFTSVEFAAEMIDKRQSISIDIKWE